MIDFREGYLSTQRQEEWVFINEKNVAYKEYFLVKLYQYYRDVHLIPGHYIQNFPSGLAFKCQNVLAPYLLCDFKILDYHWNVIDLVAANHPLVVLS